MNSRTSLQLVGRLCEYSRLCLIIPWVVDKLQTCPTLDNELASAGVVSKLRAHDISSYRIYGHR